MNSLSACCTSRASITFACAKSSLCSPRSTKATYLSSMRVLRSGRCQPSTANVVILTNGLLLRYVVSAARRQWNGSQASRAEMARGVALVQKIRNEERGGRAVVEVLGPCHGMRGREEAGVDQH